VHEAHHDGSALHVPQQAPALGETVTVFVRVPASAAVNRVHVRAVADGEPVFTAAVVDRRVGGETWWRADVTVRNPVTRYRFLLHCPRTGPCWLNGLGVFAHDVPDTHDFRLLAHEPPPAWAADAVVYQVFPDRFARSAAADARPLPDWAIPCDWDTTPVVGRGPATPRQLYGGDLDGVAGHLDHLDALGVNTVYLTPVFPARSNHRYDASDLTRVDPLLGGDAALARLARAVHDRGWRLLGDVTSNHTGDAHEWFTAALAGPDRPERGFYHVDEVTGDYESWLGVRSLPKLNWASAELRHRFATGDDAVVRRWLRPPYDLDGWRVDVANMTGRRGADDLTREVAALLRAAVVATRPDALLVAEHGHDHSGDLDADGWHGTMNYAGFTRPVWTWLRGDDLDLPDFLGVPGAVPRRDAVATLATMRAFGSLVSWRSLTHSWQLLGSHDTPRIRTVLGDPARHEVAAGLLATLPGTPMVFAGDELGLTGYNGEHSRTPMPWRRPGEWDRGTLRAYQGLLRLRRDTPALRRGGLRWLHVDPETLVFAREAPTGAVLVLARRAAAPPVRLVGPPGDNVYGGADDLRPDADGAVTLPGDGPTLQVWRLS
jgi:alpha-glucosidase